MHQTACPLPPCGIVPLQGTFAHAQTLRHLAENVGVGRTAYCILLFPCVSHSAPRQKHQLNACCSTPDGCSPSGVPHASLATDYSLPCSARTIHITPCLPQSLQLQQPNYGSTNSTPTQYATKVIPDQQHTHFDHGATKRHLLLGCAMPPKPVKAEHTRRSNIHKRGQTQYVHNTKRTQRSMVGTHRVRLGCLLPCMRSYAQRAQHSTACSTPGHSPGKARTNRVAASARSPPLPSSARDIRVGQPQNLPTAVV
jgi:hypothetical protein